MYLGWLDNLDYIYDALQYKYKTSLHELVATTQLFRANRESFTVEGFACWFWKSKTYQETEWS